ncbi:YbgA family protein [Syntrophus buswellii]|uniref:YbgA family protein n=1 Tax=Syntrophus buswellii TaxID=43774 RepID=UPI0038D369E5
MPGSFPKPVVVVSKCLGFDSCRYDGSKIDTPFVEKLKAHVTFLPVCPEVEIGLGVPRKPIRIVFDSGKKALYQPATGKDFSGPMQSFVETFLDSLAQVDGFFLKSRSPSCGVGDAKIHDGFEEGARTFKGRGFFGDAVQERFAGLPVEDEGRIRNFSIREHFLSRIFLFARFREVKANGTIQGLVNFHSAQKLLLMGYNQAQMRLAGKIVANHEKADWKTVVTCYEEHLERALAHPPRFTAMINVLLHAFGGFSEVLSKEEKAFFLESIEEYRDERIPLSVLLHILRAWSIRYKNNYLLGQTFLQPYPLELVEISDSGKGRDR